METYRILIVEDDAVIAAAIQDYLAHWGYGVETVRHFDQVLECGGAVLNISDGTLRVGGETVSLTKNEWKILQMLLENRGKVVSRSALMTRLWESDAFVDENTLTVNVTRLRKKLDDAGLPGLIHTKKGLGYLVEGPK